MMSTPIEDVSDEVFDVITDVSSIYELVCDSDINEILKKELKDRLRGLFNKIKELKSSSELT